MARGSQIFTVGVDGDATVVELYNKNMSNVGTTILLVICLLSLTMPIGSFVYLLILGDGIGFGFLLYIGVYLLSFGYLFRLYLWNRFGKEVFIIENGHFVQYYDYKLFISSKVDERYKSIRVYYILDSKYYDARKSCSEKGKQTDKSELRNTESPICFEKDDKMFESHFQLPIATIAQISKLLK